MYDYIKGTLTSQSDHLAVVEAGGIGYRIVTSGREVGEKGGDTTFFLHLHVREDIFELYGFTTPEERDIFLKLIAISGVGPKAAVAILGAMTVNELALAVIGGDAKAITRAPGVGPKLAQRLILELKDKIGNIELIPGIASSATVSVDNEAAEALISLGYSHAEAQNALRQVGEGLLLEESIRKALGYLTKNR